MKNICREKFVLKSFIFYNFMILEKIIKKTKQKINDEINTFQ